MSTEYHSQDPAGGPSHGELDDAAADGELFIRDLAETGTPAPALCARPSGGEEDDEEEGDEGMVTTMMLGEEGDRGGDQKKGRPGDDIVTTLAIGEEGDRAGE